jgi:hypothetical protein
MTSHMVGDPQLITFEDRPSDCQVVDRIWRSHSDRAGTFQSMATTNWVMVVSRYQGKAFLTIRGPESRATSAEVPAEGEWIGIHFKLGTFMPLFPAGDIRDRNDATLPDACGRRFSLDGSAWEYPTFENADTFVQRLVKRGLIVVDWSIDAALRSPSQPLSRTQQRHFVRATGLTRATILQIERARRATRLLRRGTPILEVVHDAGYFDQAHLTRSLGRFVGMTPGEVVRGETQLSVLYNTDPA